MHSSNVGQHRSRLTPVDGLRYDPISSRANFRCCDFAVLTLKTGLFFNQCDPASVSTRRTLPDETQETAAGSCHNVACLLYRKLDQEALY